MREKKIRLFMQMELETCKDECKWLSRGHHCIVNNCPEEYGPPRPLLPIPTDHAKNVTKMWQKAKKGMLRPTLKTVLKKYYPPTVGQSPVLPQPEIPTCSSSLPWTKPKSSGDDQTESDYLGAQTDGRNEEQFEISLAGESDDITGKHRDWEQIPLEQAQCSEGKDKVVPKRECQALKRLPAGKRLDKPAESSIL